MPHNAFSDLMPLRKAPFSASEVQYMNERQVHVSIDVPVHPYTCPNRSAGVVYGLLGGVADYTNATHGTEGGDRGILIATESGLVCPYCGYVQEFAEQRMLEEPRPLNRRFPVARDLEDLFGAVSGERIDILIAEYRALAAAGRPVAEIMSRCLARRRLTITNIIDPKGREHVARNQ